MPLASQQAGILLATLGVLASAAQAASTERYQGRALSPRHGTLLYTETHWLSLHDGRHSRVVLYRCPDGAAFARKRVDYRDRPMAPDVEFVDGRDGYREGVRTVDGRREVFWQPRRDGEVKRRVLTMPANGVIDAGFDAFVNQHWEPLAAGSAKSVAFLLPSAQDFLDMRIAAQGQANGLLSLRMTLDRWYGFAAPEVRLAYRLHDRRLVSFEGIGTIRDARGRHRPVRIEFPDALRATTPDPLGRAAALTAPLVGRCTI